MKGGAKSRREFLRRASLFSLAIPGAGGLLAGCKRPEVAKGGGEPVPAKEGMIPVVSGGNSGNEDLERIELRRFPPELPPLPESGELNLNWRSQEKLIRISDTMVVAGWTFEESLPGPVVHCKVGETVHFTLTNDSAVPHSMDFHAAKINPEVAFRSVGQGESVSFSFQPRYAGAFLYHCGTPPALMHIGMGMYGAIIVSPEEPLPPAKEFVLVQSEFYLGEESNGVHQFDYSKMLGGTADVIAFNGGPNQYLEEPIQVEQGDRVRFWVVNAGPTLSCAFHLIGEQFDTVYLGAPPGNAIHGVQTFPVAPGGGMAFELVCDLPGEFTFVNHAMGHGQKGAMGKLVVRER